MWILILSIWGSGNAIAISGPDFVSYAACAKAGELAAKQHGGGTIISNWSCVKTK